MGVMFKCGKVFFVAGQVAMDPACCNCCCCKCKKVTLTLTATGAPALSNLNASFGPFDTVNPMDPQPDLDGDAWCGVAVQGGGSGIPIASWEYIGVAFLDGSCKAAILVPEEFEDASGRPWILQMGAGGWMEVGGTGCKCFPQSWQSSMYSLWGNPSGPWATIKIQWDCADWGTVGAGAPMASPAIGGPALATTATTTASAGAAGATRCPYAVPDCCGKPDVCSLTSGECPDPLKADCPVRTTLDTKPAG